MNVDFYIYNFPEGKLPSKNSEGEFLCPPLGERTEVRRRISECFRRTTWHSITGGDLEVAGASIELYSGDSSECRSIMASVAGEIDNGIVALARICRRHGWSLFDPQEGKLMNLENIPKRMKSGRDRDTGVYTVALVFRVDADGEKRLVSVDNSDGRVPPDVVKKYEAKIGRKIQDLWR